MSYKQQLRTNPDLKLAGTTGTLAMQKCMLCYLKDVHLLL